LNDWSEARFVDVNRQACESLGYTRDELIGKTPFDNVELGPHFWEENHAASFRTIRLKLGGVRHTSFISSPCQIGPN
jgi:PAS domain S-box-containing protein